MHFVIVGAGYTGRRVVLALPPDRASVISRSAVHNLPEGIKSEVVDLDDIDNSRGIALTLPPPCTVLYTVPPAVGEIDVRLANMLAAMEGRIERVVYLSTTGVYGDRGGAVVTEQDPPQPTTSRAKRRMQAERFLEDWCENNATECIILRVPGIYGPGRLGVDRIASGASVIREEEANPGNRIHVDDLAAACVQAMTTAAPTGIYNVGDGDHRSGTWFSKSVAELAGLRPPNEVTRDEAKRTFERSRLSFLSESRRIDTSKMLKTLGFNPRYINAEDGIRASLDEMSATAKQETVGGG